MKIIVWNSQDKCVADYHRLIRGCDVLCLLDCGQWTVPMYALQIQKGLFHWKVEHEGLSYDIFYCLEKVAFVCMGHRTKRFFQWSGKMGERF